MKKEIILGVDAGTSSIKICGFSLQGEILVRKSASVTLSTSSSGQVELDPSEYWCAFCNLLREITATQAFEVLSIGFSTTCPCVIFMDSNYNNLGKAISYLDNRTASEITEYISRFKGGEVEFFNKVGNKPASSTCWASSISWVKKNEPERWDSTNYIGMLNSFLVGKLTGKSGIDFTQASYSGIFSLHNPIDWDDDLLSLANLSREKLLPVKSPLEKIGSIKKELVIDFSLNPNTSIALGSADTAAATFGLGFFENEDVFESVGTSGVLTFISDKPHFSNVFMNRTHVIPGKWLAHGATSMMGGSIEWVIKNIFTEYNSAQDLDKLLSRENYGAKGVVFLPYLSGERSPIWDAHAKSVWYGMTLNTSKNDLIQAVYEAGGFAIKQILLHAEQFYGNAFDSLFAVGNATRSKYWSQLKADIFNRPYKTSDLSDMAAFGAALIGAFSAKIYSNSQPSDIPRIHSLSETYLPTGTNEILIKNYNTYTALYPQLKEIMNS